MTIAIDFDGTCVTHDFPRIGKDIGAAPILRRLVERGHNLILYTMRSNVETVKTPDPNITKRAGDYLTVAVNWFKENNISLYGIQINPTQKEWTTSPKCYAELYIDDSALGVPLKLDQEVSDRPFVDWEEVEIWLEQRNIL